MGRTQRQQQGGKNPKQEAAKKRNKRGKRAKWEDYVGALKEFRAEYGHSRVNYSYKTPQGGLKLGAWVVSQRSKRATLAEEKINELTSIGFHWETQAEKNERQWDEMFSKLATFRLENLHCRVPKGFKKDPQLAIWVDTQRRFHRLGELSAEKHFKLDYVGFEFNINDSPSKVTTLDDEWREQYGKLQMFQEEKGHCLVTQLFADDPSLGRWVKKQREVHRLKKMKSDRKGLLDAIGFVWKVDRTNSVNIRDYDGWDAMFRELVNFKEAHGHVEVCQSGQYFDLGVWLTGQRCCARKNSLLPTREKQLVNLGVKFDKRCNRRRKSG